MRLLAIALTGILIVLSVVGIVGAFALPARRLLGLRDLTSADGSQASSGPCPALELMPQRCPRGGEVASAPGSPCLLEYASAN